MHEQENGIIRTETERNNQSSNSWHLESNVSLPHRTGGTVLLATPVALHRTGLIAEQLPSESVQGHSIYDWVYLCALTCLITD